MNVLGLYHLKAPDFTGYDIPQEYLVAARTLVDAEKIVGTCPATDDYQPQSWDIVLVGIATKTKPGIIIQNDNGA